MEEKKKPGPERQGKGKGAIESEVGLVTEPTPAKEIPATAEKMSEMRRTRAWIYRGVLSHKKWRPGTKVTEAEYDQAVKEFLQAPIGGKPC